ncbi:unnamed protein product [Pylaiella littoralis]
MSALSKCSPLKRKQQGSNAAAANPRALFSGGNPDWPCLDSKDCPDGRLKVCLRKKDQKEYVTCDRNVWSDKDTCKVTLSMLLASKDHPHGCQLCLCDVGGYPSIGIPTDEKDDRGYTVWENYHGVFSHCAGARSLDGKTFKNATVASGDIVGVS